MITSLKKLLCVYYMIWYQNENVSHHSKTTSVVIIHNPLAQPRIYVLLFSRSIRKYASKIWNEKERKFRLGCYCRESVRLFVEASKNNSFWRKSLHLLRSNILQIHNTNCNETSEWSVAIIYGLLAFSADECSISNWNCGALRASRTMKYCVLFILAMWMKNNSIGTI